jgi:hypothetical protein
MPGSMRERQPNVWELRVFLGQTKKQYVADAVAYYTDLRRGEIEKGVRASLATLDGGRDSAVRLLTGMSDKQTEELGGIG